jgi:hypothetical protein
VTLETLNRPQSAPNASPGQAALIVEHTTAHMLQPELPAIPESQMLRSLIRGGASHPAHRASLLRDSRHRCAYGEIVANIEAVQALLREQGLQQGDCVTAELSN